MSSAKPFSLNQLASARSVRFGTTENPSDQMPRPKLTVSDLNFFYDKFQALYNISLLVPTKKITAFIGPSGCGKSTFLRTLNRMSETVPKTHLTGKIQLGEADIYQFPVTYLRSRVGMVFQKPSPFPKSIFDNVAYGIRVNDLTKQAASPNESRRACGEHFCGRRSKIGCRTPLSAYQGVNSNASALPVLWRSIPKYCFWMSPARRWTQSRRRKLKISYST